MLLFMLYAYGWLKEVFFFFIFVTGAGGHKRVLWGEK